VVRPAPGDVGTLQPTATVGFFDSGKVIPSCASQPLTDGGATCVVAYRAAGSHTITAQYGGDANFRGSSSAPESVRVVAPPARVLGWIGATMQWTFDSTATYTKVLTLLVNGASGATVTTSCHRRGCPFTARTTRAARPAYCARSRTRVCPAPGTVNLATGFRNRRLPVGAQITVAITRPGWIGRYYQFVVRARRAPRVHISCLAPGAIHPGSRC
jgi:hypothetical protein